MTYREKHGANNEEDSLAGRRQFMGRALMGGMAAFVPAGSVNFNHAEAQTCTATAADSLVFYLTLLLNIPYELLEGSGTEVAKAAKDCARRLNDVYLKVQELDAELRQSQSKAQTSRLRHIVELGLANAELIKTSSKNQFHHATLLANTYGLVGRELATASKELLPDQELKLSANAQRILKEIIELVKQAPIIQKQIDEANQKFNDDLKAVRHLILGDPKRKDLPNISKLMLDASNAIFAAERAGSSASQRKNAAEKVQAVINELNKVAQQYPKRPLGTVKKPTATELLVSLLEGAKMWVEAPTPVGLEDLTKRSHVRRTSTGSSFPSPPLPGQISNLLDRHCGPGTWWRAGWCLGLVTPALFRHRDAKSRLPLIQGALDLFSCPGEPSDKSSLARALADLRIS
jgi:hypothetical protein